MTFIQKISAYNLGFLLDRDLPEVALTGLTEGFDSQSMIQLAGYNELENPFLLAETFHKSLIELGIVLFGRKESIINVITFYATQIVNHEVDAYAGFDTINKFVRKTEFDYSDLYLNDCYVEYITIWELKTDGLQMHEGSGLTKEQFINKTKTDLSYLLSAWLKQTAAHNMGFAQTGRDE